MDKILQVLTFLESKNQEIDKMFNVTLEINTVSKNWIKFNTDLIVENLIAVSDYRLIFMNDLIKHYLEYVQMQVSYLKDVEFIDRYLYFTTSNGKKVRLS